MSDIPIYIKIIFLVMGLGFSLFFGFKATKIFLEESVIKDKPTSWKFFQFWLNFMGSIVGWGVLWIFLPRLIDLVTGKSNNGFIFNDIIVILVVFIGITGFMPSAVVGIISSIRDLVSKIGSFIKPH